jgi:hypothetical protein
MNFPACDGRHEIALPGITTEGGNLSYLCRTLDSDRPDDQMGSTS